MPFQALKSVILITLDARLFSPEAIKNTYPNAKLQIVTPHKFEFDIKYYLRDVHSKKISKNEDILENICSWVESFYHDSFE